MSWKWVAEEVQFTITKGTAGDVDQKGKEMAPNLYVRVAPSPGTNSKKIGISATDSHAIPVPV